jgi:opacity protein-like surface antigen
MKNLVLLTAMATLLSSVAKTDVVVIPDTPNAGDTTTITTVTTGNPVTTDNLISHDFIDGTWNGSMFPDSSDINEHIYLTGKDGAYAETTIKSEDYVSIEELRLGFTSNFNADIRWWNPTESTVTMYQIASNGVDTTTQSTTFEDTTNHNYQFNNYGNTLIMNADPDMTHGTLTAGFSFDIQGNKNYNGGHAGVDVKDPTLTIDYTALSSTTVTTVEYCWQKNPPTCPGQDEIDIVEDIIDDIDTIIYDIPDDFFEPEPIPIDIEYSFNDEYFEEDFDIQDDYIIADEFFFEDDYYQDDFYEDIELAYVPETDIDMDMDVDWNDSNVELFDDLPLVEEAVIDDIVMEEEMFVEEFTEEMQDEFIEEVYEEFVIETEPEPMPEPEPEPIEEVAMVEEEIIEEEPIEEEIIDEEVAEQPSSEEVIADEPAPTTEIAEQEEIVEEPAQEPNSDVEVDLDIKVAAIEKAIQSKVSNEMQRVSLTLDVINEVVSREMTAKQADISSYFDTNAALFDTRQLPGGDPMFFMQVSLASYDKTIYATQANIVGTDPLVQHQIKMIEAKKKTSDAYRKLMEKINARSNQ